MAKINRRSLLLSTAALAGAAAAPKLSAAQTATYTPDDLKSTLTPLGGLRAGNADGTIPAWTGAFIPLPADYVTGTPRPDPFPDDKPLFSITAANLATYQDKLPLGAQELFKRHPDYRMDVYQTRRTAIAPQWVYDYTYANAKNATISADGNSIYNAYGGTPFPIPADGKQAMWNYCLCWRGVTINNPVNSYQITSSGELVKTDYAVVTLQYPYYYEGKEAEFDGVYSELVSVSIAPPFLAGQNIVDIEPIDIVHHPVRAWIYLPGQRRTRLAPELQYDTPIATTGGVVNWDEIQMFYGALDDYDCKLIGKKEMYIAYNMNRAWLQPAAVQAGPSHRNPDYLRFELHRVWVVEMTVAAGRRNVDARRVMYLDEDTWGVAAEDVYDSGGALWKYGESHAGLMSDIPAVVIGNDTNYYDFHVGDYAWTNSLTAEIPQQWQPVALKPPGFFTAGELASLAGGY